MYLYIWPGIFVLKDKSHSKNKLISIKAEKSDKPIKKGLS